MPKDKVESRIKKRRKALKALLLLMFVSVLAILVFKSEYFNVKNIIVENTNIVKNDEVVVLSQLKGKNIFFIDKEKVKENICTDPYIDNVEINRKLPNTVILKIDEKQIAGLVKFQNSYINVDTEGRMVQMVNQFPNGKIPLIDGINVEKYSPDQYLITSDATKQEALKSVLAITNFKEFKNRIYSINVGDPYNITIKTTDGMDISIGDWTELDEKMSYANSVLNSPQVKGTKGSIEVVKIQSEYTVIFRKY